MDPITLSSLIGAGSSLLGGLFGKGPSSGQQAQSHVDGIMAAAEKHKINPLTLLGSVAPQSGAAPVMGQAIANAGLSIADGMVKKVDFDLQAEQLRMQNDRLQKSLQQATLRPKVAGVYGNGNSGSSDALVPSSGSDAFPRNPSLVGVTALDGGRKVVNNPIQTDGGVTYLDNPALGGSFAIPTINGEIVDLGDWPTVVGSYAVDRASRAGRFVDEQLFRFQNGDSRGYYRNSNGDLMGALRPKKRPVPKISIPVTRSGSLRDPNRTAAQMYR